MDLYPLLIFLHVLGAVGVFAAWGIEALALGRLRQAATVDQARTWMQLMLRRGPMGPVAMLMILVTGIWMMVVRWGPQAWMTGALAGLLIIVVIGIVVARSVTPRLEAALAGEPAQLPTGFADHVGGGPLRVSLWLRVATGVGILALMTTKPGALGSLAIMGVAVVIGLAAALLTRRQRTLATT